MQLSISIGSLICNQNDKLSHIDDPIFTVHEIVITYHKFTLHVLPIDWQSVPYMQDVWFKYCSECTTWNILNEGVGERQIQYEAKPSASFTFETTFHV